MKKYIPLLLMASIILFAGSSCAKPADDFSLNDLSGKKVTLSSQRGKAVLLNFFATWCPPCRREMPSMQTLHEKMKGKKFVIMAVSVDKTDSGALKRFMHEKGYTFQVLHDRDGAVSEKYGVTGIPMTLIINKKGETVEKIIGEKSWDTPEVMEKLDRIIDGNK